MDSIIRPNMRFRRLLNHIDGGLSSGDIESIKFLCRSLMDESSLEKITGGFTLFEQLENKQVLNEENLSYLGELLYRTGRNDLVNQLGYKTDAMTHAFEPFYTKFDPFRILLHKIARDTNTREVNTMKFSLGNCIPRRCCEEITNTFSLFIVLEQRNILVNTNLDPLIQLLHLIDRQDLLGLVQNYKEFIGEGQVFGAAIKQVPVRQSQVEDFKNLALTSNYTESEKTSSSPGNHCDRQNKNMATVDFQLNYYDMSSNPKGFCVIINNEKFSSSRPDLTERKGSDMDKNNLKQVWIKLGFYVVTFDNQTKDEILKIMCFFAEKKEEHYNAFVCCILSHGEAGEIYGVDGVKVSIWHLMSYFTDKNCPSLSGKPKLFFVQACQTIRARSSDDPVNLGRQDHPADLDDFLLGYATIPGCNALRDKRHGSWYITILTLMLNEFASTQELSTILTKVTEQVRKQYYDKVTDGVTIRQKQLPVFHSMLQKGLFFFPYINTLGGN